MSFLIRFPALVGVFVGAILFPLPSAGAAETAPGYIDFGRFAPAPGRQFVEINLHQGLLSLAARFAEKHEPEAANLLRGLRQVRVNVVGLDETNATATTERLAAVHAELGRRGWDRVVTVRDEGGEDVAVFLRTEGETIHGLVVTVLGRKQDAVFVNIVGEIRPEQLGELAHRFDIEPLKRASLAAN
jgi:hypothetical protein